MNLFHSMSPGAIWLASPLRSPCIAAVVLIASVITAEARPWKDATGRTVEVNQWRVEGEKVIFVINGKDVEVPLGKLSAEDQAFAKKWAADHQKDAAATSAKKPGADQPVKLPNGDVVIQNLPSPPLEEEVRNYLPLSCTLVLEKYYQWPSDLLKLAIKMKWDPERTDWDQAGYYNAAGKEARTKVRFTEKFDLDDLAREINKGQPVLVWRCWSTARDEKLAAFAKELQNNPNAELPSARDPAERAKYLVDHDNSSAITSLIIGYNRRRGEVLLQIPFWGADYECFRMRTEEMTVSGYGFWFFDRK